MGVASDDEVVRVFLDESHEHLDGIEADLLTLEQAGTNIDAERINAMFRAVHSIKGGAGFLGFDKIKDLAHGMENLLGLMRNGEMTPDPPTISTLLKSADLLTGMLNNITVLDEFDVSGQLDDLAKALAGHLNGNRKGTDERRIEVFLPDGRSIFMTSEFEIDQAAKAVNGGDHVYLLEFDPPGELPRRPSSSNNLLADLSGVCTVIDGRFVGEKTGASDSSGREVSNAFYALVSTKFERERLAEALEIDTGRIHTVPRKQERGGETPPPPLPSTMPAPPHVPARRPTAVASGKTRPGSRQGEGSLRVQVGIIDRLMNLAGELVLARNQLLQRVARGDLDSLETVSQRMDQVTTELQDAIMTIRMQSIGIVFNKFQRVVRDLSRKLGKKIELVLEGTDVELDKTIVEAINDPLTHLIRNSVDHGIESPERRRAANKPETGTLRLRAAHRAGQVLIEIIDDGAGIDVDCVREEALAMGLYTREQLAKMTERAVTRIIFTPGFSTAGAVTDVSGRGVGMDVVHSNLAKLGGVIDIESVRGEGTTVSITLPLTLAIIPSLLVSVGREYFAVPQVNLVELVRIPAGEVGERVEEVGGAPVMRLRGELLPLVDLRDVLESVVGTTENRRGPGAEDDDTGPIVERLAGAIEKNVGRGDGAMAPERLPCPRRDGGGAVNIVVVAAGGFRYGLVVESLLDSAEIVVKPLGNQLRNCRIYAGSTILGDGHVALILDVFGIGQRIRVDTAESVEKERAEPSRAESGDRVDARDLLIVETDRGGRFAIPLVLVERIEKILPSNIETVGGRRVMQFKGGSLSLLAVEHRIDGVSREETGPLHVVIFRSGDREAGILVSKVLDIREVPLHLDEVTHRRPGVFGSIIIDGAITLLLDPHDAVCRKSRSFIVSSEEADTVVAGKRSDASGNARAESASFSPISRCR